MSDNTLRTGKPSPEFGFCTFEGCDGFPQVYIQDYAFPDRNIGYVSRAWIVDAPLELMASTLPHKIWFTADAIYRLTQQGEGADDDRPGWNPGHPIGNLKWRINFHDDKPEEEFVNATLKGVTYAWELTNDEKCCAGHQLGVWRD